VAAPSIRNLKKIKSNQKDEAKETFQLLAQYFAFREGTPQRGIPRGGEAPCIRAKE